MVQVRVYRCGQLDTSLNYILTSDPDVSLAGWKILAVLCNRLSRTILPSENI